MRTAFRGEGRRVGDGAAVPGQSALSAPEGLTIAMCVGIIGVALALCPSHDSFEAYLAKAAEHPSGFLGSLSAIAERLSISVMAETRSLLIMRTGSHRKRQFIGAFGTWVPVPTLPSLPTLSLPGFATASVCRDGHMPHELFALMCCFGFIFAQFAPRTCMHHGTSSLSAIRAGRFWTLLTSNVVHFSPAHLLHNVFQILSIGPVVHAALGCERAAVLLLSSALASSMASVLWHGYVTRQPNDASAGGSGVAMALMAANAALYPHILVRFYGIEIQAAALPWVHLLVDAIAGGGMMDVIAHAGGAACGWVLVRHYWRVRVWGW